MISESFPTPVEPASWLVSREQYHTMAEAGVFSPEEKVELINGRIVTMMPIGDWHWSSSARLHLKLVTTYADRALVVAGGSIGLGDKSEPQPDIAVYLWRPDFYAEGIPEAKDAILVIEISDTSRVYDLGTKHDLYAEHGIPEYWVVDGKRRCVHVFRDPLNGLFRECRIYQPGESIPLPQCGGAMLPVVDTGL